MKIVFFGDSLTQGTYGANYVNKVAAALRGHHFINEGVNGDTSLNLFRRVERDVIAHQPDAALIMIGVNDALSQSEPVLRLYYRYVKHIHSGQITPIAFRENMRAILMQLGMAQIRTLVVLPPVEYRPALVAALRQMNTAAAEVCRSLNVPTLDLLSHMTPAQIPERPALQTMAAMRQNLFRQFSQNPARYERWRLEGGYQYSFDGIHLTEAGAQQMADQITAFLRANGVPG
jgi:lysophospholipase L1-like esterase